jgi:hypothetical protein
VWRLLPTAVFVELAFDVLVFVHAIMNDVTPNISSSIVRFLLMATLGGLAVFKGVRWARRLFAGLLYFGGAAFVLASFAPLPIIGVHTGRLHFEPALLAFAVANLLVATAATVGGRAMEARFQALRTASGSGPEPRPPAAQHQV